MYVLGVNNGCHDASACVFRDYELISAVSLERLTRKKGDGVTANAAFPTAAIVEAIDLAGISPADIDVVCMGRGDFEVQSYCLRGRWRIKQLAYRLIGVRQIRSMMDMRRKQRQPRAELIFDADQFKRQFGLTKAEIVFFNHHQAHAVVAYFYSEFDDALIYTADAVGDDISYSARIARRGHIELLFGRDDERLPQAKVNSVGWLYSFFTAALGFIPGRHEGKLTGLAGFGRPIAADELLGRFSVDERGEISSNYPTYSAMEEHVRAICGRLSREDAAASVQEALENLICRAISTLVEATGMTSLAVADGIFANVRLNRVVLDTTGIKKLFIFPAMGDEGLCVGGCLIHLLERDGADKWQENRRPIRSVYLGRDHSSRFAAAAAKFPRLTAVTNQIVERAVDALMAGEIVAIYTGAMEFGPRALGARSILATPERQEVNTTINARLQRSEFMPFAPVVLRDHATDVFDINVGNEHATRFMTITCAVKPAWRDRIPAVVHVDGSARPQTIAESDNPLYFRVLQLFYERTGIPVLVNTSFNVHEEPIVDSPEQALRSLVDGRVDHILTETALYSCEMATKAEPDPDQRKPKYKLGTV